MTFMRYLSLEIIESFYNFEILWNIVMGLTL